MGSGFPNMLKVFKIESYIFYFDFQFSPVIVWICLHNSLSTSLLSGTKHVLRLHCIFSAPATVSDISPTASAHTSEALKANIRMWGIILDLIFILAIL